ncbi:MAG: 30S ribosomal protein S20 [Phycisphaerae bacterium]|nr:30S ribosomal protein S20 [Phycisphaerae bacterium]
MAHSLSAKKRVRQNIKRRARNRRRKAQVKQAVKQFDLAIQGNNPEQAAQQLRALYKTLDQVAAKGTIHKKTAARKKSRLARRLNKLPT